MSVRSKYNKFVLFKNVFTILTKFGTKCVLKYLILLLSSFKTINFINGQATPFPTFIGNPSPVVELSRRTPVISHRIPSTRPPGADSDIFFKNWIDIYLYLKGIYHRYTFRGVVLKQLNYPISILPILIRSVDRVVNDYC